MKFTIGDKVSISVPLSYLKTAEQIPMLRPPDLVSPDEIGEVVGIDSADLIKVRFRRGVFLIPIDRVEKDR